MGAEKRCTCGAGGELYRGYHIEYCPKPGPRGYDFEWSHEDFDGPGDNRQGYGGSEQECRDAIDELIEEDE